VKPKEFRTIRLASGKTQAELAAYLGVSGWRTVQKWEYGERKIPGPVAKLMQQLKEQAGREEEE
jgi:DNA-binding transcriptional regulator YiaG